MVFENSCFENVFSIFQITCDQQVLKYLRTLFKLFKI